MRFRSRDSPHAITVTRRGARLALRVVRGRSTYRWTRAFPDAEAAERVGACVERAVKLAGYTDIDGEDVKLAPPDPLQQWKDACLDDDDARLVYGDMLAERGDPRAELIAAQARAEEDEAAAPEAARLVARYSAAIFGGLAPETGFASVRWKRGFIDDVVLAPHEQGEGYWENFEWQRHLPADLGASLLRLGSEPSAELLRSLTIRNHSTPTQDMIALLVALVPLGLETLSLAGGEEGDATELLNALPRLRRLTIKTYRIALRAPVRAPHLVELDLHSNIDSATVRALIESELPRLERIYVTLPPLGGDGLELLQATFRDRWGPRTEYSR